MMRTNKRVLRMQQTLAQKQPSLQIFLENVHSSQNLSAIIRSCEGVGVLEVYYATPLNESLKIHKTITQGAHRWTNRCRVNTQDKTKFLAQKKAEGFQVVVTHLSENSCSFRKIDYTKPTLIVVGNEKEGVSLDVIALADKTIIIPMQGMVQSLNVSVATALVLYEAQRQREEASMYGESVLSEEEQKTLIDRWSYRDSVARRSKGVIALEFQERVFLVK